jgi:hypothetical protein
MRSVELRYQQYQIDFIYRLQESFQQWRQISSGSIAKRSDDKHELNDQSFAENFDLQLSISACDCDFRSSSREYDKGGELEKDENVSFEMLQNLRVDMESFDTFGRDMNLQTTVEDFYTVEKDMAKLVNDSKLTALKDLGKIIVHDDIFVEVRLEMIRDMDLKFIGNSVLHQMEATNDSDDSNVFYFDVSDSKYGGKANLKEMYGNRNLRRCKVGKSAFGFKPGIRRE